MSRLVVLRAITVILLPLIFWGCSLETSTESKHDTGANTPSASESHNLGEIASETRPLRPFDQIVLSVPADVTINIEAPPQIKIEAPKLVLDKITASMEGETLKINLVKDLGRLSERTKLTISTPHLNQLSIKSAANCSINHLSSTHFTLDMSGAGNVTANGTTQDLDINVSGAANVGMLDLAAKDAKVHVSGAGSVELQASQSLKARISGTGSINYKGNAKVDQNISGIGTISKI